MGRLVFIQVRCVLLEIHVFLFIEMVKCVTGLIAEGLISVLYLSYEALVFSPSPIGSIFQRQPCSSHDRSAHSPPAVREKVLPSLPFVLRNTVHFNRIYISDSVL